MRNPFLRLICCLFLAVLVIARPAKATPVTLAWDPSPDESAGSIASYTVYFGLQDFTQLGTNVSVIQRPVGLANSASIDSLVPGLTYFFAVAAVDTNGVASDFSNLATYSVPSDVVPLPPLPGDGSSTGGTDTGTSTGTTTGSGGGTTSGGSTGSTTPTNQINLLGSLPRLWLYPTNGQALLAISGTVGATLTIQSTTNPAVADSWVTISNITLSALAPNANLSPGTTLEKAFIPALEAFQDPAPLDGTLRYYRIYMPLGYPILADQVLAQQGFTPRLIAVRCPGLSGYIVCYVTEEAAYLDYNDKTYIVKLQTSGPTIREVATTVATSLSQNWTSASEFTVADTGTKYLFATVVQTDDPLTDPPLGVARASSSEIIIDF